MRIVDTTNPGNINSAQTGRTEAAHSADSNGRNVGAARKDSASADSVQLSGFTNRLSRAMEDAASSRANRVSELAAAVRSGSYKANPDKISHALVNHAITSGGSEPS